MKELTFSVIALCQSEELTPDTSALESLYSCQITSSKVMIKPIFAIMYRAQIRDTLHSLARSRLRERQEGEGDGNENEGGLGERESPPRFRSPRCLLRVSRGDWNRLSTP